MENNEQAVGNITPQDIALGYSLEDIKRDVRRFGVFTSSTDPQKISRTVTGIVATVAGTILSIGAYSGMLSVLPAPAEVEQAALQIGTSVGLFVQAAGLVYTAIGGITKVVVWIGKLTRK